jgi:hypothetical protein
LYKSLLLVHPSIRSSEQRIKEVKEEEAKAFHFM